jgi:polyhydroxybutyrate depolymerase
MMGAGRSGRTRTVPLLALGALAALGVLVAPGPLGTGTGAAAAAASVPARLSAGCALAEPVLPGTSNQLLAAGGDDGGYVREVPPSYTGRRPLPVVIDLHGWGEPAAFQVQVSQLGAYGAAHNFLTVTPQIAEPALVWRLGFSGKDVAFMGALLDTIDSTLCVDTNRIFVTGYSYGAFLTSTLACVYAGRIAAVAPVAGIQSPAGCHPSRPVAVVAFHGTADPFVPYLGGVGSAALNLPAPDGSHRTLGQVLGKKAIKSKGPTIPGNTAAWARRNGCAPGPTRQSVAARVTLIAYSCPKGDEVELYRVTGGGHAWPGSPVSVSIARAVGFTTMAISADQIMWAFFTAHPLRH